MSKKKIVILCISIILILLVIGILIYKSKLESTDAYKFKKEYEEINDKKRENTGKANRELTIDKNNPMKYATAKDIVEKMDNKETFIVYFGFADCPWCRSVINNLIEAAKNKNIDTIYYVDVKNIRDIKELKDNEIVTTKEGTKDYLSLLNKLNEVLDDYKIIDENGTEIETGEKRIYAPNVVAVVNGKAEELTDGVSEKLKDPYAKLTKEMNKESIKKFECLMKCLEKANVCTQKTSC